MLGEGRNYFDAFVLGAKAGGVSRWLPDTSKRIAVPKIGIASNAGDDHGGIRRDIQIHGGRTDPRYSKSVKTHTAAAFGIGTDKSKRLRKRGKARVQRTGTGCECVRRRKSSQHKALLSKIIRRRNSGLPGFARAITGRTFVTVQENRRGLRRQ